MKNYSKTKEEWEKIGVLELTPEDRKDKVVNALNIAVKWLIEFPINIDTTADYINVIVPVVIVRIANNVDISEDEVLMICKEINIAYKNFDPSTLPDSTDPDAEFFRAFCDAKINQLNSN
jgi:hypothetical protein